jgi:hypothetical protein
VTPSERSRLARDILDNEVFTEACGEIEKTLKDSWKATPPDAWKRREGLYERLQALEDIKAQLQTFIDTAALETTAKGKHGRSEGYNV